MPSIYEGNTVICTATVGGVVYNQPYVINNVFVVAKQTKAAGELFTGVYKDVVVTLPYYKGTVHKYQHAHFYTTTNVATDYEGREIQGVRYDD